MSKYSLADIFSLNLEDLKDLFQQYSDEYVEDIGILRSSCITILSFLELINNDEIIFYQNQRILLNIKKNLSGPLLIDNISDYTTKYELFELDNLDFTEEDKENYYQIINIYPEDFFDLNDTLINYLYTEYNKHINSNSPINCDINTKMEYIKQFFINKQILFEFQEQEFQEQEQEFPRGKSLREIQDEEYLESYNEELREKEMEMERLEMERLEIERIEMEKIKKEEEKNKIVSILNEINQNPPNYTNIDNFLLNNSIEPYTEFISMETRKKLLRYVNSKRFTK